MKRERSKKIPWEDIRYCLLTEFSGEARLDNMSLAELDTIVRRAIREVPRDMGAAA